MSVATIIEDCLLRLSANVGAFAQLDVAAKLEQDGVGSDVISMPCMELFEAQDDAYRADLIPGGDDTLIVSIEAGTTLGWERYTGRNGLNIGLDRFGASAPAPDLFERFGFTVDAIVPQIHNKLKA